MRTRVPVVLLVTVLFLASYAPAAFAQATADDGAIADDSDETNVTVVDCSQVQQAVQGQYGDATAVADDESVAAAANTLGISQTQVNACLGSIGGGPGDSNPPPDDGDDDDGPGNDGRGEQPEGDTPRDGRDEVMPGTAAAGKLPNTGGPSLLGAALGLALVAGGLSLIRLRR